MPEERLSPSCHFLVVAAGKGERAGGNRPKQYQDLAGKPLIRRTVEALLVVAEPAQIHCVIASESRALFNEATEGLDLPDPVIGGATRQESVANGLRALGHIPGIETVMVHDAARPFVTPALIRALRDALEGGAVAVIPGTPVTDTIKRIDLTSRTALETPDRAALRAVQTPQAFDYALLREAHDASVGQTLTDDAAIMEVSGHSVGIVDGVAANIKVTHPEDFVTAERYLIEDCPDVRVGTGYDVHRFEPGDAVTLGGIMIPHSAKLKGHSDADVALHALTDAILAALSDGDIGAHFPPSDPQWKGAPSETFLRFAADRVRARGGILAHLSVILICEAPKIGPHRSAMQARIAEIAGLDAGRVSVQATTTEKLGFTGRGEGIAAQATATVRLPLEPRS